MSNPVASVEIQARSTGLAAQLREARAQFGRFADGVKSQLGRAFEGARSKGGFFGKGGTLGNVFTGIGQGVGQRVTGAIEDAALGVVDFDRALTKFGISARKSPAELEKVRASMRALSKETGIAPTELVKGAQALVDLAGAGSYTDEKMRDIAKAAKATGAEMGDVITTSFSLQDALKIKDTDLQSTLSGLVNQSKDGAVHFNQMASEIIGIAPRFARFGVVGREGAIQLGAMFQVTRTGFKDASETATGLQGIFKGLNLHADRFRQAGVKVFDVAKDGTKHFRPLEKIFDDINHSVLAKNPDFLAKAFGRGEGEQAFNMLRTHLDLYKDLIKAGDDATTIERDFQTVMESPSGRLDKAWNDVKLAITEAFTPERINAFADAIAGLADKIGPVVGAVSKIGSVLGGVYNLGRGARGAFERDKSVSQREDEWQIEMGGRYGESVGTWAGGKGRSDAERADLVAAAKSRIAGRGARTDTVNSIMDAESDEKTTNESLRRAVFATQSTGAYAPEKIEAGRAYLKAAGVTDEGQKKIIGDAFRDASEPMLSVLRDIAKGVNAGTEVKIGSEPVAAAVKSAPSVRRGVAK